ncbi:hypothetical protein H671_8g19592 [Cricetulus griseus]|nr:hypothetical protein H671_8g19592 [Cricetulus griseus]
MASRHREREEKQKQKQTERGEEKSRVKKKQRQSEAGLFCTRSGKICPRMLNEGNCQTLKTFGRQNRGLALIWNLGDDSVSILVFRYCLFVEKKQST